MSLNSSPQVDVFISCFNSAETIRETLESVLQQPEAQIYMVDDGSNDSTPEICQKFYSQYPDRFSQFIKGPNQGFARRFLEFHRSIKAPYWTWIGSDDVWKPNFLGLLVKKLEDRSDFVAAFSSVSTLKEDAEVPSPKFEHALLPKLSRWELFVLLTERNFLCAPGALIRTESSKELRIGACNDKLQDQELWLKLLIRGSFYYEPKAEVKYRVRTSSLSQLNFRPLTGKQNHFSLISRTINEALFPEFFNKFCSDSTKTFPMMTAIDSALVRVSQYSWPVQLLRLELAQLLIDQVSEDAIRDNLLSHLEGVKKDLGLKDPTIPEDSIVFELLESPSTRPKSRWERFKVRIGFHVCKPAKEAIR
jgi:glycosyltransferase involved in cell wall biosynthesis